MTEPLARHRCVVYDGVPSKILSELAGVAHEHLKDNYRCLCLNSPAMVAGMRCYLAALDINVEREIINGSLVLSSEQSHLVDGHFDVDRMLRTLEDAVENALRDGYKGLWATGDMTWEFGPEKDFTKLVEYEQRLDALFHKQGALCGICQYHKDTLPPKCSRQALRLHDDILLATGLRA